MAQNVFYSFAHSNLRPQVRNPLELPTKPLLSKSEYNVEVAVTAVADPGGRHAMPDSGILPTTFDTCG